MRRNTSTSYVQCNRHTKQTPKLNSIIEFKYFRNFPPHELISDKKKSLPESFDLHHDPVSVMSKTTNQNWKFFRRRFNYEFSCTQRLQYARITENWKIRHKSGAHAKWHVETYPRR